MSTDICCVAALAGEWPPMPIEPSWIKEGHPVARGKVTTQSGDQKVSAGLWSCEPGKFEWIFSWDEFATLFAGEADVRNLETGTTITVRAGDMVHFPLGARTLWHVKQTVRKYFVARTPEPLRI